MDLLSGYRSSGDDDGGGGGGSSSDASDDGLPPRAHPREKLAAKSKAGAAAASAASARRLAAQARASDRRYLNAAPQPSLLASRASSAGGNAGGGGGGGSGTSSTALATYNPTSSKPTTTSSSSALTLSQPRGETLLMNNPLKSQLLAPAAGPSALSDPSGPKPQSRGDVGTVSHDAAFDESTFTRERTRFQREGRAMGPDERGTEVNELAGLSGWGEKAGKKRADAPGDVAGAGEGGRGRRKRNRTAREEREAAEREYVEGSDDEARYGVWGPPTKEERAHREEEIPDLDKGVELAPQQLAEREYIQERNRQRGKDGEEGAGGLTEAEKFDRLVERKMSHLLPPRVEGEDPQAIEPKTIFHGEEEFDYRGRSWMAPPSRSDSAEWGDVDHHRCYVPKKCVGRLTGHNKGVHRVRLFPRTGHLILSGGLEGKCKVWSLPLKKVMRTYIGHSAAVRDVAFNNDGSRFLSCSFDRFVRLWDTETGEVKGTYTNRRVPYVVKFYPHDDNTFVVGCSDNKIVAYDSKTGDITQEYNHHLAPVNAIAFVDEKGGGTKMVTTSDDKKVLVWEWDIGVPVKYISDPTMHSMPTVALHPTGQFWAGSGLDNTVCVYQAGERFALQRKKKFTGHVVAGYACDLNVSPDGQFLASGDGEGRLFVWDWRRGRTLGKFRAHEGGPATGCVWHPVEPSTVVTCGWDGIIKIWQ